MRQWAAGGVLLMLLGLAAWLVPQQVSVPPVVIVTSGPSMTAMPSPIPPTASLIPTNTPRPTRTLSPTWLPTNAVTLHPGANLTTTLNPIFRTATVAPSVTAIATSSPQPTETQTRTAMATPTSSPRPTETPYAIPPTPTVELCRRMQVVAQALNVRTAPRIRDNVVEMLPYGTVLTLTNDEFFDDQWAYRQIEGQERYVAWFAINGSVPFLWAYQGC